jgi:hypothetical protein
MNDEVVAAVSEAIWWAIGDVPSGRGEELVEQLASQGYAVVKLPEMVVDEWGMKTWSAGDDSEGNPRTQIEDDGRISFVSVPNPTRSAEQAAALGAALIAAAQHVQEKR